MKMKPGGQFNEGFLREDIKKIAETVFFPISVIDVLRDEKGIGIKIKVVENPDYRSAFYRKQSF
jgi:hypothetical protein